MASKCKLTVLASSLSFFHSSPMIFEISGKVEAKKTHLSQNRRLLLTWILLSENRSSVVVEEHVGWERSLNLWPILLFLLFLCFSFLGFSWCCRVCLGYKTIGSRILSGCCLIRSLFEWRLWRNDSLSCDIYKNVNLVSFYQFLKISYFFSSAQHFPWHFVPAGLIKPARGLNFHLPFFSSKISASSLKNLDARSAASLNYIWKKSSVKFQSKNLPKQAQARLQGLALTFLVASSDIKFILGGKVFIKYKF